MKKLITIFAVTITAIVYLVSCGKTTTNNLPQTNTITETANDTLNDWQKEVLTAEGLPT
jgi:hypothetical protein